METLIEFRQLLMLIITQNIGVKMVSFNDDLVVILYKIINYI